MWRAVRTWWEGEFIPHENEPGDTIVFIGGMQRRHWTARASRLVWMYLRDNHRWLIGTLVAIAGVIIAAKRL